MDQVYWEETGSQRSTWSGLIYFVNHACYSLFLQGILDTYSTVFSSELGILNAMIRVDPTAQPYFHKPRAVPYALKTKTEKTGPFNSTRSDRTYDFSEWAAPIILC